MDSSFGLIRFHHKVYNPGLYASVFIDKHWLQAPLILMSISSARKKVKEDQVLRSEFSTIFSLLIFSNRESYRASIVSIRRLLDIV